jgi:hypothetical protein
VAVGRSSEQEQEQEQDLSLSCSCLLLLPPVLSPVLTRGVLRFLSAFADEERQLP